MLANHYRIKMGLTLRPGASSCSCVHRRSVENDVTKGDEVMPYQQSVIKCHFQ